MHVVLVSVQSLCSTFVLGFCAEKTWKVLEDAIHEINNHNASGLSFEELYRYVCVKRVHCSDCLQLLILMTLVFCRNAYNMVINKFGDQLYNGLEETIVKHLQLIEKKVEAAQGESFLRELKLRWDHHNKSMQMIRDILMVCRQLCYLTS